VASSSERGAASRTSKRLDPFGMAMLAISKKTHEWKRLRSRRTGTAGSDRRTPQCLGVWGLPRRLLTSHQGRTGRGDGPAPDEAGEARRQAGPSSGGRGESRRWSVLRLAPPREVEGRRWSQESAPKQRKTRAGGRPRAGTRTHEGPDETSLLEMGRRENSLRSKEKASRECCQARGTKVRMIHHREGQYLRSLLFEPSGHLPLQ